MESLLKYVPFVDFLLKIDQKKYYKFSNIRKWILSKKTYPTNVINKIEEAILTQYKNLLLENKVKIPKSITDVFETPSINLCSDDEDDEGQKNKKESSRAKEEKKHSKREPANKSDDDDDLEIISINYIKNESVKNKEPEKPKVCKEEEELDIDEASINILNRIDQLAADDLKTKKTVYEPINYNFKLETLHTDSVDDDKEAIFQRRTPKSDILFKRRTDFTDDDEVEVENFNENRKTWLGSEKQQKESIICLDSDTEGEVCNDGERPSTSNATKPENKAFKTNTNNNGSNATNIEQPINEIVNSSHISNIGKPNDKEVFNPASKGSKTVNENGTLTCDSHKTTVNESVNEASNIDSNESVNEVSNIDSNKTTVSKPVNGLCIPNTTKSTNATPLNERINNDSIKASIGKPANELLNADSNSNGSYKSEKLDILCHSIESVLPDMTEILNDVEETNCASGNEQNSEVILVKESDKDIEKEKNTNLDPEKISKILEDISSKSDFEMETFYEALQVVKQMNTIPETPPPAPPPLITNTPPLSETCYTPPQQQQQFPPPMAPCNALNANFVSMEGIAPVPKPKINVKDPRIRKQLQTIKNSPIFSYNILNTDLEDSIRKICHETVMQPSTLDLNKNNKTASVAKTSAPATSKSSITYGEYKRRQMERKLERKREEERQAKIRVQQEREERQKLEIAKSKEDEIRSQLLNTLNPCKEQIYSLLKQQINSNNFTQDRQQKENLMTMGSTQNKNSVNNPTTSKENSPLLKQENLETTSVRPSISNNLTTSNEAPQKENLQTEAANETKGQESNKSNQSKNNKRSRKTDQRLNRIYSELKCTVKGFDQIQDYIADEANFINDMQTGLETSPSREDEISSRLVGLRRRSSMHALSAITEQLGLQSDYSDSDLSQSSFRKHSRSRMDSSSESQSQDSLFSLPKRRKTIDEPIKPSASTKVRRISDGETSNDEAEASPNLNHILTKEVVIKLPRISQQFIRRHSKRAKKETNDTPPTNIESVRLKKTGEIVQSLQEPNQKVPKLKKYNNDCQMTERNTTFCVLCRSKPMDLTNHYIGRHKTESYVSRLDWSDLEDIAVNTHFAKLLPGSKNCRYDRYEVECPFCKENVTDQFINLYNHYAVHTGEYAYQCSHCNLAKPYKVDIQSHILHSKTCRNATIQIMYRYPPHAQCIYLHYCSICNFVQLNEANVLKHLREHHHPSKATTRNVQKCILAAISDGPEAYQAKKSPPSTPTIADNENNTQVEAKMEPGANSITPTASNTAAQNDFKVDDDDIPVSNEPCCEDDVDVENFSCEDMLKYMHEEPAKSAIPMTVIHNSLPKNLHSNNQILSSQQNSQPVLHHQPIKIKTETIENVPQNQNTASATTTSPLVQLAEKGYTVYEKYRSYPPNVKYLGLYKCMIDDCYYSTDSVCEIILHLTEHAPDALRPNQYLQCPYCCLTLDVPITPIQLVDHVSSQHGHLNFQCSMCCYRSCDASNVHQHQQMHHYAALTKCKIYKSPVNDLNRITGKEYLNEQIERNIFKISCKLCGNASFYHTHLLINHLYNEHNLTSGNNLNIYSCIYCPLTVDNKNQLKIHIAQNHPAERVLVYDHNAKVNNAEEDCKNVSNIIDISEPVPYVETETTSVINNEAILSQDVKPDLKQLLFMNEETVKVRLRKLTAHTGIAPDNLYQCPEQLCGGFFSNFDVWLRHMKIRHLAQECKCPHCTTPMLMPLEQFATHFEEHRRHTYICFYCSTTSSTESLARKHAAQKHSEFRTMRFEKIRFNINYSYNIVIQSELFQEREQFIAEFLRILDERLKELESNEIKNLKQQWPVRENLPWLDDYLQYLPKRRVARRCLVKDCHFRTLKEEVLYHHLSTSHSIAGTQFNCSKCDYHVEKCNNLDELFNHIKLHNEYHFICSACSLVSSSRSKMSLHIQEQHTARDVPVVHLFRAGDQLYHKIYIVFADDQLTFSTMKNCFCCSEHNMSGDVFSLHLKRYHNLTLNYYCEMCTNFSFKSLQEVKPHFECFHHLGKFKIRCELTGNSDLHVISLNDFQIQILAASQTRNQQTTATIKIKDEPMETSDNDNVLLIEEDDILIENSLKEVQDKKPELPKLKCASFSKLLEPNINTLPATQIKPVALSKLKCTPLSKLMEPNTSASTLLSAPANVNNQGQENVNNNGNIPLLNTMNALKIPVTTVQNNSNVIVMNNTIMRPVTLTNSNNATVQVIARPLNVNEQVRFNTQTVPNTRYIIQNSNAAQTNQTNTVQISNANNNRSYIIIRPNSNLIPPNTQPSNNSH